MLVDTSIIIESFRLGGSKYASVVAISPLYISPIVAGELFVGAHRVVHQAKALQQVSDFIRLATVLEIDLETARIFGQISASLFKKGKPLPINDVWIAASALQHNLTLITKDRHFSDVESLKLMLL